MGNPLTCHEVDRSGDILVPFGGRLMNRCATARAILQGAIAGQAFPAAVLEVGARRGVAHREAFGSMSFEPGAPATDTDTVFDLASLTKVLATTALAMLHVERGRLALDDQLTRWLPEWRGQDRADVTIRDLLAHASGLTAWLPLFRDHAGRADFEAAICALPLEYPPRSQSVYSDLGFILLGFVLHDVGRAPLDVQFERLAARLDASLNPGGRPTKELVAFTPPPDWRQRIAPTEIDSWRGRLLVGEVHDENAWALGGVAGHAGLFGTAEGVGRVARALLAVRARDGSPASGFLGADTLAAFLSRTSVPGSSRALGWDTMLPTSSCGTRMSAAAFGHTGFTGTSLWLDPTADAYIVLLTNRVHPSRDNDAILEVRRSVHDAIMSEWPAPADRQRGHRS